MKSMKRRYLEISAIGSACGKMKFEPIERTLLYAWARHSPGDCKDFLIRSGAIRYDDDAVVLHKDHDSLFKKAKTVSVNNSSTKEFKSILNSAEEEFKTLREGQGLKISKEELQEFRDAGKKVINTNFGKNSEDTIIKSFNGKNGNDKMHYYNIGSDYCIGGKHDASVNDMVVEIKTRMKEANVRKNEYDLYQLFGYLLAMGVQKGKIIQQFNNIKYDSDVETENEYGIVDSVVYREKITTMLDELNTFFSRLDNIICNKRMTSEELQIALENKCVCLIANGEYINKNSKYSKLFYFI